jgi:hypothetical protein
MVPSARLVVKDAPATDIRDVTVPAATTSATLSPFRLPSAVTLPAARLAPVLVPLIVACAAMVPLAALALAAKPASG